MANVGFISFVSNLVCNRGNKGRSMKIKDAFYWLLVIFVAYLIVEIIRRIFGGSLGFEQVVIGLLIANLGYVINLHTKISEINASLSEHLGWHRGRGNSQ